MSASPVPSGFTDDPISQIIDALGWTNESLRARRGLSLLSAEQVTELAHLCQTALTNQVHTSQEFLAWEAPEEPRRLWEVPPMEMDNLIDERDIIDWLEDDDN